MQKRELDRRIGLRLKIIRDQRRLTQKELAPRLGLDHRQTLAAIEDGERRITPAELVQAAKALEVDLDTFTDPYRLVGEGEFNFRAKGVPETDLEAFEDQAGRWIATYRELSNRFGSAPGPLGKKLELTDRSSFEEAAASGEQLWAEWELGAIPADRLKSAIERHVGTLILYVDAAEGISGAASHLPKYDTILVNRRGSSGRRYFDLAHELFHILTWDAMPPPRIDEWEVASRKGNRREHLADNFAGALLMPSQLIQERWESRGNEDLAKWVGRNAFEFRVSGDALKWRLVTIGLITVATAKKLTPVRIGNPTDDEEPLLFNQPFVSMISEAVDSGILSLRRAAGILGLGLEEFAKLCVAYGSPLEYDLSE